MDLVGDDFIQLYAKLYACANSEGIEQLDVYPQIRFLCDYFDKCVFEDGYLEAGKTYILPIDVNIFMYDEDEYGEYTNPDSEYYDPDLAPFVESHNKHIEDGEISVTLRKGTEIVYDKDSAGSAGPYYAVYIIDGYPMEWYDHLIFKPGEGGAVPFLVEA